MGRRTSAAVVGVLVTGLLVTGCTDQGGTPGAAASGSGRPGATGTTSAPAPRPVTDPRQGLPAISSAAVQGLEYRPATARDKARFKAVGKASAGLLTATSVQGLSMGGKDTGAVAVYRTRAGLSTSATFQDQYIVQLLNAVAGPKSLPRFVRAKGQVVALTTGGAPVAGWFDGDRVVLVYRDGRTPDLARLAAGVHANPPTT